jgi:hypothetical protein
MKKTVLFLLLSGFCLLSYHVSVAKDDNSKFGKVSIEELNATSCPIDSNAHAYYLFDKGSSHFFFGQNGFQINYDRHFRIKILDKAGFENASINIPYSNWGSNKDNVSNIKAYTYSLEGGKVIKSKLEKNEIFDEQTSKYLSQKKFALPNVKEGSVIEVSYSLTTDAYWRLQGWQFQSYIPVLQSNYDVKIPEYFRFNQFFRGTVSVKTKTSGELGLFPQSNGHPESYSINVFEYSIENVPAFPIGEHLTTPDNYIAKVDYELASIQIPGSLYKDYTTTWDDVTKTFLDDEDFGYRLKMTGFLKDSAEVISKSITDEKQKMQAAFNLIKSKIKWNEISSCWCSAPLKKTFETGVGNAADVNLNLVALLKQLDLKAYPVVLSTRSNGMIHPVNASINQMNYVVALCRINDVSYLLDATDKYAEIDVLPTRCLNNEGLIVDKDLKGWEKLLKGKKSKEITLYTLNLSPDGKLTGKIEGSDLEFKALEKRNRVNDYESIDKYIEKVQESNEGLTIKDYKFTNLDTTGVDLKYEYTVEITDRVEVAGDLLFFNPMLFDGYEKNPFSLEKREYPVEYAYPIVENVTVFVTIPDGYQVESLPKPVKVSSEGNDFQFTYKSGIQDNKIMVMSSLQINKTMFLSDKYSEIKGFFENVVGKHLEKVVLKKI